MACNKITCGTLNVRGLSSPKRQYQLMQFLERFPDLDIIAVQEAKIECENETHRMIETHFMYLYDVVVSHAKLRSGGCLLLIKKSLPFTYVYHATDNEGRVVMLDCKIRNESWRIVSVYAPNDCNECQVFFESILPYMDTSSNLLLLRDFNCVLDDRDRSSQRKVNDQSTAALRAIIDKCGMTDIFENGHRTAFRYTHFQNTSHARLDRIYVSLLDRKSIQDYKVIPAYFSDHCLVVATVGTRTSQQHPAKSWKLWKLNVSTLKDEDLCHFVYERTTKIFSSCKSWSEEWERLKLDIRQAAIERCNVKSFNNQYHERDLNRILNSFCELGANFPGSCQAEIRETKLRLDLLHKNKLEGAKIRARMKKILRDEAPNKRFLRAERKHFLSKHIESIEHENKIVSDPAQIKAAFQSYYGTLFGKVKTDARMSAWQEFLEGMPVLGQEDSERLSHSVSTEEIRAAITSMATNSSPGPNGLSAEFYKTFKEPLSIVLQQVIKEAEFNGIQPPSFRRLHTILIPKKRRPIPKLQIFGRLHCVTSTIKYSQKFSRRVSRPS